MSTNKKALLVVNPISGGIDKSQIIDHLQDRFEREQNELSIYYTSGKNDKEQLKAIVKELQPDRVLVTGGDGTIKLMAEILKNTSIPIGLSPPDQQTALRRISTCRRTLRTRQKLPWATGSGTLTVSA